ncbi:AAWKG family protein [Streptomyces sp. NPDC058548]|uniref:AAWKG family protein n=1 Tax=Streptomyces sp. NPDC058548 TaxID=3346545 RepID=UPI0036466125
MPVDLWASAAKLLTGYPMPDRSTLFQELSGTDGKVPLMNVKVESLGSVQASEKLPTVGPNVEGHSYVLGYYTTGGGALDLKKITIDFLWNPAERPAQPGTPLDNYIFGPLNMLNGVVNNPFSTQGSSYGGLVVDPQNAVNLRTFSDVAGAYDRSSLYFGEQEAILKQWADSLGHEDADMRGSAADAFAALIRRMEENYKGYKEQLTPPGFSAKNFALLPVHGRGGSLTKQGDTLIGAANAVHQSAYDLVMAWHRWAGDPFSNPMQVLNHLVYDAAMWIHGANLGQVDIEVTTHDVGYSTSMQPGGSFQQNHPTWGDLSQVENWSKIGEHAIYRWNLLIDTMLVPAGNEQLSKVNNAFVDASAVLTTPITTRNTSPLGSDGKGGDDGNGGSDENTPNIQDILDKLGLGGDGGGEGSGGNGSGGNNRELPPPPNLNDLGNEGGNGADGNGGSDGTGNEGGGNRGVPDPRTFLADVPPPTLNGPGGSGSGGGLNGSGLNLPDGVPGPGGLPGTTGSGGPGGTGNPTRTSVNMPAPDLGGLPGSGLPGSGLPDSGLPGSGLPGSGLPNTRVSVPGGVPDFGGSGSGLPGSGLPGTTGPDGTILPGLPGPTGTSSIGAKPPGLNRDGSGTPIAFPDGSTRTTLPDGSVVTTSPDGTKVTRSPDGTTLTEKPDGTKITAEPNGTTTTEKPDGSKRVLHPGGLVTLTSPDGDTLYLGPDGKPLGERPDIPLTTLPTLNAPGLDLPGVSSAGGYGTTGGGATGGSGGTSGGGGGGSLPANPPAYEEAGYDLSTDFPAFGVDALGGSPNGALGGMPNGSPTGAPPMMPGMGAAGMGGMGGAGGGMGAGGDRVREFVNDPAGSPNRMAQGPGAQGTGGTPPYMPPPGGGQNGAGQQTQSSDRERANWLAEEEDVWGTEEDVNPAVLGREEPGGTGGAKNNAFMTGESR